MNIDSIEDMEALGARISSQLKPGDVILLQGDLGVGKSVLARAIVRDWLNDPQADVPSPSFTLVQSYEGARGLLQHFDLYRVHGEDELIELGLPDLFENATTLVEWPERLGSFKPANAYSIVIHDRGDERRQLALQHGDQPWKP